jgi:hypothetical protein
VFRTPTVTPGRSAPLASCTTPLKLPVGLDCALIEGARANATPKIKSSGKRPDAFLQFNIKLLSMMELISFSYGDPNRGTGGGRDARARKVATKS